MALLTIDRAEADELILPPICICCGAPAVVWKERRFMYHNPRPVLSFFWGGTNVQINNLESWQLYLNVPLCKVHRHHWRCRTIFIWGGLLACVAFLIGSIYLANTTDWYRGENVLWAGTVLSICWLVGTVIAYETSVHQIGLEEDTITLQRVAEKFTRAYERPWSQPSS
jgi:hypothetical protein